MPENLIDEVTITEQEIREYKLKMPKYIAVHERSISEWGMYIVYNCLRTLYVSVWFYYIPFVFLLGQYGVPYMLNPI